MRTINEIIQKESWKTKLTGSILVLFAFFLPLSTSIAVVLFPLAAILSLFSDRWKNRWRTITSHPVAIFLIAFVLLYIIGIFYSPASQQDILHRFSKLSVFVCATALLISFVCESYWQRYILNAFLMAMLVTLTLSYIKYFFHPSWLFHSRFDNASVFKDHIIQNFLMAITAFIFFYQYAKKFNFRWLYGLLAIAAIFNVLFISDGRSGYFIFGALLFYTGILYFRWQGLFITLLIAVVLSGLAFHLSNEFRLRIIQIVSDTKHYQQGLTNTSIGIRIQSIKNAYLLFKEKPWLGHGTGSFRIVYATLPQDQTKATGIIPLAYNSYLNVGVELGILGIIFLLLNFILQWQYSFFLSEEYRYLVQILLISMIIGCLANPWLSDTTELHLYALFLVISFSRKNLTQCLLSSTCFPTPHFKVNTLYSRLKRRYTLFLSMKMCDRSLFS